MKEEVKRFYDFPFDVIEEKLELKGNIIVVTTKDEKGNESKTIRIITAETKEEK